MTRFLPFAIVALALPVAAYFQVATLWVPLLALTLLGGWDLAQTRHSLYRNYPVSGHFRELAEGIRPQIRQYFVESDTEGEPFNREQRSLVYQRAKDVVDALPFGTELDVARPGFEWINHSIAPARVEDDDLRIVIGNEQCSQAYSASLLNISAMSFGALSAAAIRALNKGAKAGGFAHDTGEGGLSPYHLEHGGDIIWELGSGYFGCRTKAGLFDPDQFADKAAHPQVKMIEIKLSQGAKPGHGGILPGAKVSAEIAQARGVPEGKDCVSPARHTAFGTPLELLDFIAQLRELTSGKPVGFKLCVGRQSEFLAICKAMRESRIYPDFIVVDGKEGGTGAAPPEFVNRVGTPLRDGLTFVHNALIGTGLRDHIRLGASGKVISGFDMAMCLALGANWCNSARGFMMAVGCLQSQRCHTNTCPVGVATQDPSRQRALVVEEKYLRVANFHRHTVAALCELTGAAGLTSPQDITLADFRHRSIDGDASILHEHLQLKDSELLSDSPPRRWADAWQLAHASSFQPQR